MEKKKLDKKLLSQKDKIRLLRRQRQRVEKKIQKLTGEFPVFPKLNLTREYLIHKYQSRESED